MAAEMLQEEKMFASFLITFREALEAALIVGIILGYLIRTKQTKLNNVVYIGIVSGIVASIIGAVLFTKLAGGFEGRAEQIFEGTTMLLGALLLTTMIFWMMKQRHIAKEIEHKVASGIEETKRFGLFFLVFIAVLREGIETVIFLGAASFVSTDNNLVGAIAGLVAALLLGYLIFVGSMKINIKKFFKITTILLILFAAGLVAHGIHEFEEAKVTNPVIEHVWDINPQQNPDGSYPALHEKGVIGSFMNSLFGYNGNPSLVEVIAYLVYMLVVLILWKNIGKVHKVI